MRALVLLALALVAAPWNALAAPAPDDVAWLADLLGVAPADLPAAVPGVEGAFGPAGATTWPVLVPIAEVAADFRAQADGAGAGEPVFLGAGVRGTTGSGVRWTGAAFGPEAIIPCMAVTYAFDAGPTGFGNAYVGVHSEVPPGGLSGSGGVARMDVQLLPAPAQGAVVPTPAADSLLLVGSFRTTCYVSFTLRITTATFEGDGTIGADGM